MSRYHKILELISIFQPKTIVETGTWNGHNAIRMLKAANKYYSSPQYVGYDLFDLATSETDAKEFNVKPHHALESVHGLIQSEAPFAEIHLVKGDTNKTLNPVIADFAFIDGGHSLETIANDYQKLKGCSVVVMDDYYYPDKEGKMPDISKIGCNKLVETIPHTVIKTDDPVEGGGLVGIAITFGVEK